MASIGPVTLSIFDQPPSNVLVQVSYLVSATHHDMGHEQAYREVVELIGVDTLAGEDQVTTSSPSTRRSGTGSSNSPRTRGPSNEFPRRFCLPRRSTRIHIRFSSERTRSGPE